MKVAWGNRVVLVMVVGFALACSVQSSPGISTPVLSFQNNQLIINYAIEGASPGQQFAVRVEISTKNGAALKAQSLTGDVGKSVQSGNQKTIIWDLAADNILLNEEVYVQILAEAIPLESGASERKTPATHAPESKRKPAMGRSLLQSAVYPGLGLKSQERSRAHLLKGVLAYGGVIGGVVLKSTSAQNYSNYQDSYDITSSNNYYNKAVQQQQLSNIMLISAAGIWAIDLIWVALTTKDSESYVMQPERVDFRAEYDPEWAASSFFVCYKF